MSLRPVSGNKVKVEGGAEFVQGHESTSGSCVETRNERSPPIAPDVPVTPLFTERQKKRGYALTHARKSS